MSTNPSTDLQDDQEPGQMLSLSLKPHPSFTNLFLFNGSEGIFTRQLGSEWLLDDEASEGAFLTYEYGSARSVGGRRTLVLREWPTATSTLGQALKSGLVKPLNFPLMDGARVSICGVTPLDMALADVAHVANIVGRKGHVMVLAGDQRAFAAVASTHLPKLPTVSVLSLTSDPPGRHSLQHAPIIEDQKKKCLDTEDSTAIRSIVEDGFKRATKLMPTSAQQDALPDAAGMVLSFLTNEVARATEKADPATRSTSPNSNPTGVGCAADPVTVTDAAAAAAAAAPSLLVLQSRICTSSFFEDKAARDAWCSAVMEKLAFVLKRFASSLHESSESAIGRMECLLQEAKSLNNEIEKTELMEKLKEQEKKNSIGVSVAIDIVFDIAPAPGSTAPTVANADSLLERILRSLVSYSHASFQSLGLPDADLKAREQLRLGKGSRGLLLLRMRPNADTDRRMRRLHRDVLKFAQPQPQRPIGPTRDACVAAGQTQQQPTLAEANVEGAGTGNREATRILENLADGVKKAAAATQQSSLDLIAEESSPPPPPPPPGLTVGPTKEGQGASLGEKKAALPVISDSMLDAIIGSTRKPKTNTPNMGVATAAANAAADTRRTLDGDPHLSQELQQPGPAVEKSGITADAVKSIAEAIISRLEGSPDDAPVQDTIAAAAAGGFSSSSEPRVVTTSGEPAQPLNLAAAVSQGPPFDSVNGGSSAWLRDIQSRLQQIKISPSDPLLSGPPPPPPLQSPYQGPQAAAYMPPNSIGQQNHASRNGNFEASAAAPPPPMHNYVNQGRRNEMDGPFTNPQLQQQPLNQHREAPRSAAAAIIAAAQHYTRNAMRQQQQQQQQQKRDAW